MNGARLNIGHINHSTVTTGLRVCVSGNISYPPHYRAILNSLKAGKQGLSIYNQRMAATIGHLHSLFKCISSLHNLEKQISNISSSNYFRLKIMYPSSLNLVTILDQMGINTHHSLKLGGSTCLIS